MSFDITSQICLAVFGITAIFLLGTKGKWRKYGYIAGMLSQPFWFYQMIKTEQWGILVLCIFYFISWCLGIYNYWIKKDKNGLEDNNGSNNK